MNGNPGRLLQILNGGSAWISRVVMAGSQLVVLRLITDNLGDKESFSIYALLGGLAPIALLADLGIGLSIQNQIVEARAHGKPCDALILGAITIIVFSFLTVCGLSAACAHWLGPWYLHRDAGDWAAHRQEFCVMVACWAMAAQVFWSVAYRMWYGLGHVVRANVVLCAHSLAAVLAVLAVRHSGQHGNPLIAVLSVSLPPAFAGAAALIGTARGLTSPLIGLKPALRAILARSMGFWGFSLLAALVLQTDYLVLSRVGDAKEIALYSVSSKIYMFVSSLVQAFLATQAPHLTHSFAVNDLPSLQRRLRWSLLFSVGCAATLTLVFSCSMPLLIRVLSPRIAIQVPIALMVLFSAYQLVRAWTDSFAVTLVAESSLRSLWILVPLQGAISLTAQIILCPRFGAAGIVAGLLLSFLLTVVWGLPLAQAMLMRKQQTSPQRAA